ncbi:Nucleoside-diphosphate-sugar epimerase [Sulfitobacter marinus]|uniref:Nucleoside-diphosphate-sugar epimerase n=1 Tax=Sulfitobacter marinus TaxID=394264 RepID=A0A1I6VTR0_9RHOB|nr:SDR family oxidoreductase [Sulfitobacter marinus]SFT17105.1 Nucleoside-diphosphate-sugar epimerase [Sulfitobacter marinus]
MNILIVGQGYIGSYLTLSLFNRGHSLTVCSVSFGLRQSPEISQIEGRYQDLPADVLASFDVILWLAGHSSVGQAIADPSGAVRNNCFDLLEFAQRKPGHVRLIYASTASLYSVSHNNDFNQGPDPLKESEARITSLNAYDSSKAAFDALVGPLAENTCGLRLGTVCGYSPKLREELVFNSMNIGAISNRQVRVANPNAWRSLLFLEDLSFVLDALIYSDTPLPRFINVASLDTQIGSLAHEIAAWYGAEIVNLPDTATYSFRMSTDLMTGIVGSLPIKKLSERCGDFAREMPQ